MERGVGFAGFVEYDVSEVRFDFFAPDHIFLCELDCFFRVVFEFDEVFVLLV